VLLVDDEDAVEQLAADGADEAFGDRVRPGCLDRCSDDLYAGGGEYGIEGDGEFGVAVPDEKPEPASGVVGVHGQVAGQLGQPRCGRVCGDTEDVDPPMTKNAYSRCRAMVSR
jgi:hypothetical protein